MKRHNQSNTAFLLPPTLCPGNRFQWMQQMEDRSYFFHKYWEAHGSHAINIDSQQYVAESFNQYVLRVTAEKYLQPAGRRPQLDFLRHDMINVAVHARRGDFVGRRIMVSVQSFIVAIRQIFKHVIYETGLLSDTPVRILFYSEGRFLSKNSYGMHDISRMTKEFVDSDQTIVNRSKVTEQLLHYDDQLGKMFSSGLEVVFRISENTIQSVHEMVAADIFIGSASSFSIYLIGSLSCFILACSRHISRQIRKNFIV